MEGEGGKSLTSLTHILVGEKMGIQDDKVGEGDSDEQPQIQTDCRSKLVCGANLQSVQASFNHSYYPNNMTKSFYFYFYEKPTVKH